LTGSTAASAAMISSADQPLRCWFTMSDCKKTPQPMARLGMALASNARFAYCSSGML